MFSTSAPNNKAMNRISHELAVQRKAAEDTQYFWDLVNKNYQSNFGLQSNSKASRKGQELNRLFGKKYSREPIDKVNHEGLAEEPFVDDSIPVERSGIFGDAVSALSSFDDLQGLNVPSFAMKNIQLMRYNKPTPIQKHAIPLGVAGLDLMCCAQTGSGKTFSFLLPVVTILMRLTDSISAADAVDRDNRTTALSEYFTEWRGFDAGNTDQASAIESNTHSEANDATNKAKQEWFPSRWPSIVSSRPAVVDDRGVAPLAVILAPTRELALQIHLDAERLAFGSELRTVCLYGGGDMRLQLQELSVGCDLIIATPGRLSDLVERGIVSLFHVCFLVLDEADRMLDMGFEPQIRRIVIGNGMPTSEDRQTFMFSATFPPEIQSLAREFLREYVWIGVGRIGSTVENITQRIVQATSDPYMKVELLMQAINETSGRTLVFVQKRRTATWLTDFIRQNCPGIRVEEIHGDRSQKQREYALRQFRDGRIRILIATDVAARGLDVPMITHVIQFDLPISGDDFDVYVHRIGRTGRAGMDGLATAFYVPGREVGEGNGRLAPFLLKLLQENKQNIPEWFLTLDDLRRGGGKGSKGQNSQNYSQQPRNNSNKGDFKWRDTRSNSVFTPHSGEFPKQPHQMRQFTTHQSGVIQYPPYIPDVKMPNIRNFQNRQHYQRAAYDVPPPIPDDRQQHYHYQQNSAFPNGMRESAANDNGYYYYPPHEQHQQYYQYQQPDQLYYQQQYYQQSQGSHPYSEQHCYADHQSSHYYNSQHNTESDSWFISSSSQGAVEDAGENYYTGV